MANFSQLLLLNHLNASRKLLVAPVNDGDHSGSSVTGSNARSTSANGDQQGGSKKENSMNS